MCKFGLYEVFKVYYSDILGEENSYMYRTALYLAASASAEFFADIALSPMEAAKVRRAVRLVFKNRILDLFNLFFLFGFDTMKYKYNQQRTYN